MQSLRGSTLNPRTVSLVDIGLDDGDSDEQLEIGSASIALGLKRSPINPSRENVTIAACDASSVKIGETETGMIFAIRAVAVWRLPDRVAFTRWGPLLFHIPNSDGQQERYRDDESRAFGGLSVKTLRVLTKLRNHVERWVQEELAISVKDGIVLLDGSLTAGTPDNPSSRVQRILSTARKNDSIVVALSKSTQLTVGGKNILGFSDAEKIPHIIDITSIVESEYPPYPIRFLGRVCVSKLSPDGFLFRTDIDRDVDDESSLKALGRVAGTDVIFHGYPETLRIAHIFSTFTANEILAVQRFVASNHRVNLQARPSLRRSLFGPFGTSRYVA
ncbi:MAG TPA: DNA double-strand break repair nuclease NurA [Candidatus Bathyarchaeia archaeon]|nr:DNA double-strand break repair nuclease NurA [Candidatus Bathyarchaeia archaeon]